MGVSSPSFQISLTRLSGAIGIFGGLMWGILWMLQTFVHGPTQAGLGSGIYGPILFFPWILFVISWLGFYMQWRHKIRILGHIGYTITFIAMVMIGAGLFLVEVIGNSDAYIPVFVVGLLGSGIGFLLFGTGVLRSGFWPRRIGIVLLVMGLRPFLLALSWPIRGLNPGVVIGYASLLVPELLFSICWLVFGYFIGFGGYIPTLSHEG